jgi:hypothetical protein
MYIHTYIHTYIQSIMNPLSKNDNDTSKQQQLADNPQDKRIEDIKINELPAHKSKVIASKISKFARGFKIPDYKKPKIKSKSKVHKKKQYL